MRAAPLLLILLAALAGSSAVAYGAPLALSLAILAILAVALRWRRRTRWDLLVGVVAAALAAVSVAELRPVPTPETVLAAAGRQVEDRWRAVLARLIAATADPPLAGGDYGWVEERRAALGGDGGVAVLTATSETPLSWSGWTSVLDPGSERASILSSPANEPRAMVVRRGLAVRLLVARRAESPPELVIAAETPLPRGPSPEWLAAGFPPDISARLAWRSFSDEPTSSEGRRQTAAQLRSLVPLMGPAGSPLGRVQLALAPSAQVREARLAWRRRMSAAVVAGALLAGVWLGAPRRAWLIIAARLALGGAWQPSTHSPGAVLAPLFDAAVAPLPHAIARWIETPLDAALTACTLLGIVAVVAPPSRAWKRRVAATVGAVLLAFGLWSVHVATRNGALIPGEVVIPTDLAAARALVVLALVGAPWAGLWLVARAFAATRARAAFGCAAGGALLAALVHGAGLAQGMESLVARRLAPEIEGRREIWRSALRETLDLAVPPPGRASLVPDRDAFELWAASPLARLGLASGVFKFDNAGKLADPDFSDFASGLPPQLPAPELAIAGPGAAPARYRGPTTVTIKILGTSVRLDVMEVARPEPEGGSWVAAVLDEPGNVPSRGRLDLLRRVFAATDAVPRIGDPALEPRLAWFDGRGRLAYSDLDAGPTAPRAPPATPRWRDETLERQRARLLEIPDGEGTVTAIVFPPQALARAAICAGWVIFALLVAAGAMTLRLLTHDPRATLAWLARTIRPAARRFRAQVAFALLLVGLVSLVVLGLTARQVAREQVRERLTLDAARSVGFASKLLEDFLAVREPSDERTPEGSPPAVSDSSRGGIDAVAAWWLSRTLGEALFVWRGGELTAASRPDLVQAGLWPERLDGATWERLTAARQPVIIDDAPTVPGVPAAATVRTVHGPFREPGGGSGAVTVPLVREGYRSAAAQRETDRALLVSAALLTLLGGVLTTVFARRLVRPLADLRDATRRIAAGEFTTAVPETGFEETRELARAFQGMATDLAAQRRSLEERRQVIETLIREMPVAVVAATATGRIVLANPRAGTLLFGALATEVREIAAATGPPALRDAVLQVLAPGTPRTVTLEAAIDGAPRQLRVTATTLPGLGDHPDEARLVIIEDLTDAVRSERLVAWAEMARRVAHEVKNPLTPIRLVVDHVRRVAERGDPDLPQVLERCLTTIADQVEVLREASNEFSDYARLLVARPEPIDLPAALARWLAPFRLDGGADARVRLEGDAPFPEVALDPRLMRRALVNLVENGLTAAGEGGRVTVRWAIDEGAPKVLRLEVEDDGPGFDARAAARLFQPGATTRETGSGLGLPIAREAIEAQGGRIGLETRPGGGARFVIRLPQAG